MCDELGQHMSKVDKSKRMAPGLYQVDKWNVCAGFIITPAGSLGRCAHILRKKFHFWKRYARRIAP